MISCGAQPDTLADNALTIFEQRQGEIGQALAALSRTASRPVRLNFRHFESGISWW